MVTVKNLLCLTLGLSLLGCASILPGHDPLLVNAQRLQKSGLVAITEFCHWERLHASLLQSPLKEEVHAVAEQVRRDGLRYLDDLNAARLSYKSAKTPDGSNNVVAATAALRTLLEKTEIELIKAKGKQ